MTKLGWSSKSLRSLVAAVTMFATMATALAPSAEAGRRYWGGHGYYGGGYYHTRHYYPRYHYPRYGYYPSYYSYNPYHYGYRHKRRNHVGKYIAAGVGLAILGAALSHRRRW